ncbi:MAG: SUMF1/EgtB/PvdO family nonheme iron enzyme [Candidatus Solibacter sp.]
MADYAEVQIGELGMEAIDRFLHYWAVCLYPNNSQEATHNHQELASAVAARPEIRRLARNPVMLTALAVVNWNERRLPEQRAELYESIVVWLARSREQRPGRESADRCLELLGKLARSMQERSGGRVSELSKETAAETLAIQMPEVPHPKRLAAARQFLDSDEVDSGIIVSRGTEIRFWHLTFQEYLCARAISGLADSAQRNILFAGDTVYKPEWREVVLLLAGILRARQGREKVDGLFKAALDSLGTRPTLVASGLCAGILGAVLRDLQPFAYYPPDARFGALMETVMAIFKEHGASAMNLATRIGAADALGYAGDPRLSHPKDKDYWITVSCCRAGTDLTDRRRTSASTSELHSYQIGRYPVTVQEYCLFVADDGYGEDRWWGKGRVPGSQPRNWDEQVLYPSRPVVGVTWYEASAYCEWAGVRLPSALEWERVAFGSERRRYPWGTALPGPDRANYSDTGVGHATPVGLFPGGSSPEGVADLAGNVWEWVADWYVLGGSFADRAGVFSSEDLVRLVPFDGDLKVGFRCARTLSISPPADLHPG